MLSNTENSLVNSDITIDPSEVTRFEMLAEEWWNPKGKFRVVHAFNQARRDYIVAYISQFFGQITCPRMPLDGLKILDVGCGAGLVSEPLALMGAEVVGVDAAARNIEIAKIHASGSGALLDYRHGTASSAVKENEKFDVVLNLEVVEHVSKPNILMKDCASFVRPGGLMFVATLNRTIRSFVFGILGAEYVLRWLPVGTHHWKKFLKPSEIAEMLKNSRLTIQDIKGVTLNPVNKKWRVSEDLAMNYLLIAKAPDPEKTKDSYE